MCKQRRVPVVPATCRGTSLFLFCLLEMTAVKFWNGAPDTWSRLLIQGTTINVRVPRPSSLFHTRTWNLRTEQFRQAIVLHYYLIYLPVLVSLSLHNLVQLVCITEAPCLCQYISELIQWMHNTLVETMVFYLYLFDVFFEKKGVLSMTWSHSNFENENTRQNN